MIQIDEFTTPVTAEQLATVAQLANEQLRLEKDVEDIEKHLKEVKQLLAKIQQGLLPDALSAAGLSEFKTIAGDKVCVEEDLSVSVPKDKKDSIMVWLTENGHEAVITGKIYVELPKNSSNERQAAIQALIDAGLEPVEDMTVNTATLKAILRKCLASGEDINLEDFGAFAWKRAKIKRA